MKNNTVLLAEDDPNFGSVLRDYLELNDFDVVLATDGVEALQVFKSQESFDLCILDVMMPHKDGFTLAADIRKIDKEVPLIFLTAKSMKEDMVKGFQI
jgi:two-component system OmpR family response regulator